MNGDLPQLKRPAPVRFWWANRALRWYFAPEFHHLDRVAANRPTLLAGNHSVFGMLQGAVLGSRANCAALMRRGEHILVFPGGAREVFKHKGEAYRLIWKERYGFVRLAVEHGYAITPYATVGAEDAYDVLLDSNDYMKTPLGRALKASGLADRYLRGGDEFPPVVRGLGLTVIPRPEKLYFAIGKPVDMTRYRGQADDPAVLRRVRARVSRAVTQLIAELHERRAQDTGPGPLRRLVNRL